MRITILMIIALFLVSCGPTYVRGSEEPELDEYAMSTGLDKKDLEKLLDENMNSMMSSAVIAEWKKESPPPIVAIFPIANETSEHISNELNALLSDIETRMINGGVAQIVSREKQDALIQEVRKQQGGAFDSSQGAVYGRQLGARFFITGKVYDTSERTEDEKRVQYYLFMQIIDVETGLVRWQNKAELTKGIL